MEIKKAVAVGAAMVLGIGVLAGGHEATTDTSTPLGAPTTLTGDNLCTPNVPPTVAYDPCTWANQYFRTGFIMNMLSASYFKKWQQANPNEWSRLVAYMADPSPWTSDMPAQAQTRTYFGAMIRDAISACKATMCGAVAVPAAGAPTANDSSPPSTPQDLTAS